MASNQSIKQVIASTGCILIFGALACAQDSTGNRIVVPQRDSSHPRVVVCHALNGNITIRTHAGTDVIVEGAGRPRTRRGGGPPGMQRIDIPRGLEVSDEDNTITIRNHMNPGSNYVITVPVDTSLQLKDNGGHIDVDGVHGEVTATSLNGGINLMHISGTVTADSNNGSIKVSMARVDPGKPLAFSTLNGAIDVTFPPDLKASLRIKSLRGPVFSDFDVTLGQRAVGQRNNSPDGRFLIRIDRDIVGTINGGGTDIAFRTLNGGIYIRKQK